MSAHPFSSELRAQLASLDSNMKLLRAFDRQFPFLPPPWFASPVGPTIGYLADASTALRAALGEDGWEFQHSHAWKDVGGIRVEVRIPQQTRPLTWATV